MYESNDKMVSHPTHYQSKYGFEVVDVIEEYTKELFGICATDTANMIKYICRWKQKNGIQDLEKAIWYATHIRERSNDYINHTMRCYIPIMNIAEVIKAFTDGMDDREEELASKAIILACDWWTYNDYDSKLDRFIESVHELIKYEKENK